LAETIRFCCKSQKVKVGSVEGLDAGRWLLVDLFDVIVHVFDPEARHYYDLELLWGDAPKVDWKSIETPRLPVIIPTRAARVHPVAFPE
jgi:ribosome-associated protein